MEKWMPYKTKKLSILYYESTLWIEYENEKHIQLTKLFI